METAIILVLQFLGTVMLADFLAGIVHWAQDAYGTEETPLIGPLLIRANIVHHHYPRFFTRLSWWHSSQDLVLVSVAFLAVAHWFGFLTWQVWLFALISANANQVHKWAHQTRTENGPIISFLQDIRVLLTPRNHAVHHSDPKNTYYCPVTNLVNPLLEPIRFWTGVEWTIWRVTGVRHRHDTSNPGQGPAPAWLKSYRASPRSVAPRPPTAMGVRARLKTWKTDERGRRGRPIPSVSHAPKSLVLAFFRRLAFFRPRRDIARPSTCPHHAHPAREERPRIAA